MDLKNKHFLKLLDFTPEEISHLTAVVQKQQGPVNEAALRDYAATIRREHQLKNATGIDDLLAVRDALRNKGSYNP